MSCTRNPTSPLAATTLSRAPTSVLTTWSSNLATSLNNNQNFSKVTFVVDDGQLNITPKDIKAGENMKVEAPANVTYNGQPQQEEPVVKDGDKTLVKNVDYTLSQ